MCAKGSHRTCKKPWNKRLARFSKVPKQYLLQSVFEATIRCMKTLKFPKQFLWQQNVFYLFNSRRNNCRIKLKKEIKERNKTLRNYWKQRFSRAGQHCTCLGEEACLWAYLKTWMAVVINISIQKQEQPNTSFCNGQEKKIKAKVESWYLELFLKAFNENPYWLFALGCILIISRRDRRVVLIPVLFCFSVISSFSQRRYDCGLIKLIRIDKTKFLPV